MLKDQTFSDNDNDEFDYIQKINMNNLSYAMFEDNDYIDNQPSLGIRVASGGRVLNYTLDFTENPLWDDLETSDITIMGKTYYILDTTINTTLILLDSAESSIITEGETKSITVNGKKYDVKISFIGDNKVKLDVNGEITNQLTTTTNTYKLKDGTYIGIKEINYNSKDTGISNVEFSVGTGKLKLVSGSDIEMNDDAISGLSSTFTNSAEKLTQVDMIWNADDDLFVANGSEAVMPGFKAVKFSYGGENFPAMEKIAIESDGDNSIMLKAFPLKDGPEDINILYNNGSQWLHIGKDSTNILRTTSATNMVFDGDTDAYFVASWADATSSESYLVKAGAFSTSSLVNKTTISYKNGGVWKAAKTDAQPNDVVSMGSVDLTIGVIDKNAKTVNITINSGGSFNTLYSKEGMKLYLPFNDSTVSTTVPGSLNMSAADNVAFSLVFSEEDKNENVQQGKNITLSINVNSDDDVSVASIAYTPTTAVGTSTEIGSSDIERNFVYSDLGTEVLFDKSGNQQKVTLIYHGDEAYGNVYLNAPSTTVSSASGASGTGTVKELGSVSYTDANVPASTNLIVVGGSCVNKIAAELLGVSSPTCGAAWEQATSVGAGAFLIQSFDRSGKVATLVAGYNAEDTRNAATALKTLTVDTMAGKKYKGTSATSVELQTTTSSSSSASSSSASNSTNSSS